MNQTITTPWSVPLVVLKNVAIWLALGLGLMANVLALIVTGHVKVGFPVTRLLFRLQFVWDILGCIILSLYWITYHANLSSEIINGSVFVYLWASLYPFILQNNLSLYNIVMLSFDRFWSVVWFRTYPRESKFYRNTLVAASYSVATIFASTVFTMPFFTTNVDRFGVKALEMQMKVYSVIVLVISYITPAVLVLVFQIKILLVLRNLKRVTLSNISSNGEGQTAIDRATAQNVRSASLGIIVIIITFLAARMHCQLEFLLSSYGLAVANNKDGWQTECIFLYSANSIVNPFALIFTSTAARMWALAKLFGVTSAVRRWCTPRSTD